MTTPTTVTGYRSAVSARADLAVAAAQQQVTQGNGAVVAAQVAVAAVATTLAADQVANASIRSNLANAATPSDATAWVAQLQQNLITTRIDQAALGTATDKLGAATRGLQAATEGLQAATAAQQQAATDLQAAQADDSLKTKWAQVVSAPSMTDALSAVNAATTTTLVTTAGTVIEAIIGIGMLDLFRHRRDDALAQQKAVDDRTAAAATELAQLQTAHEPLTGDAAAKAATYLAKRRRLAEVAQNTVQQVTTALAALTAAANLGALSTVEQNALTGLTPAAKAEVSAEAAVFADEVTLRADEAVLDEDELKGVAGSADFDPAADATVQTDLGKVATDETKLEAAVATLTGGQSAIDAWEVAIPPPVMDAIVAVVEAESTITVLKAVVVATVLSDLATAESNYAAALDALDRYRRSAAVIASLLASRLADAAAFQQVWTQRLDAAIRGLL